jgi:SAM domain (Sterile alpha motif)
MADSVADWLHRLRLEQYAPAFAANDIDPEVLPELTANDPLGLGITSIGHGEVLRSLQHMSALNMNSCVVRYEMQGSFV